MSLRRVRDEQDVDKLSNQESRTLITLPCSQLLSCIFVSSDIADLTFPGPISFPNVLPCFSHLCLLVCSSPTAAEPRGLQMCPLMRPPHPKAPQLQSCRRSQENHGDKGGGSSNCGGGSGFFSELSNDCCGTQSTEFMSGRSKREITKRKKEEKVK